MGLDTILNTARRTAGRIKAVAGDYFSHSSYTAFQQSMAMAGLIGLVAEITTKQ